MIQVSITLLLSLLLTCLTLSKGLPRQDEIDETMKGWVEFKNLFNKEYESPQEEYFRRLVYLNHVKDINNHNERFRRGEVSFELGLNNFSDMLQSEIKKTMTGYIPSSSRNGDFFVPSNETLADDVDWRKKGAVTPVKNQGHCGSCWAFSTTGSLEGQHFIKNKKLVSLSEQNLVDCSTQNSGCMGGNMALAFDYIKENKGIDTEESYPYKATQGECKFSSSSVGATVTGYKSIAQGDENALKNAVATIGPITVGIDARYPSFRNYKSGIYFEPKCSPRGLDHAVLVVGYGSENGKDYWLVKNSWGTSWGENGYIKMARNQNNNCGIATAAIYPLV